MSRPKPFIWAFLALFLSSPIQAEADYSYLREEGQRLISIGKYDEALKMYQNLVLENANDDESYVQIGHLCMIKGQPNKARDAYETALQINPENMAAAQALEQIAYPDGMTRSETF